MQNRQLVSVAQGIAHRIRHLVEAMNRLDLQIKGEVDVIKDYHA